MEVKETDKTLVSVVDCTADCSALAQQANISALRSLALGFDCIRGQVKVC